MGRVAGDMVCRDKVADIACETVFDEAVYQPDNRYIATVHTRLRTGISFFESP